MAANSKVPVTNKDFEELKGRRIDRGTTHRRAFLVQGRPRWIMKVVPYRAFTVPNWTEWIIWQNIRDTELAPHFGECRHISRTGRYLIMERLNDITIGERDLCPTPPGWLKDAWYTNCGRNADGDIKVRDYGNVDLAEVLSNGT